MGRKSFVPSTLILILLVGCDQLQIPQLSIPQPNDCPVGLSGFPSPAESGIQWGNSAKVEANIVSLLIECIPERHPSTDKSKGASFTDYEIAVTAKVNYQINDTAYFNQITQLRDLDSKVIFEAVTSSGVVLGSTEGGFTVIRNGTNGNVSASIHGLSPEEIKRISRVVGRWKYTR